jgi:hypothetical protein
MLINANDEARVTKVLTTFIESAVLSLREAIANATTGIFSSNDESAAGITGLQNLLTHTSNATPTSGISGNLNRATYTFWRNQVANVASDFSANGYLQMLTLYLAASRGDETPNVICLTRSAYTNYVRNLTATISYNQPLTASQGTLDANSGKVTYAGTNALIGFDDYVPANAGYMLNSKYVHFVVHPDRNAEVGAFVDLTPRQDAIATQVRWAGNLCISNMARQGLLLNADTD